MAHRTVGTLAGTRQVTGGADREQETCTMTTPSRSDPLPWVLVVLTMTTGVIDAVSVLGLRRVFTAT